MTAADANRAAAYQSSPVNIEELAMSYKHLTWYVLQDGTHADPNDCAPDEEGVLRHKDGLAVAMRSGGVPQSVGVDAEANKNVEAAEAGKTEEVRPSPKSRELTAEKPKGSYKTRGGKAD